MKSSRRRIGIFGGTFDPTHIAHLAIAEWTQQDLNLDEVVFIPNRVPPHKTAFAVSTPEHRLKMLELAVAGNSHFSVSTIELAREGPSYTIDTLQVLLNLPAYAGADLFLIIGADNFVEFHEWHKAEEILSLCALVVYPRYGVEVKPDRSIFADRAIMLQAPVIELASTEIRKRLASGRSIRYLVPEQVFEYIERVGVYKKK